MRVRTILRGLPSLRSLLLLAAPLLFFPLELRGDNRLQGDDGAVPVAVVADEPLTADAFRHQYVSYLLRTGLGDTPTLRTHILQRMIEDRLLAREALRLGAADQPEYRIAEERHRRKLLIDLWVRRALYDSIQVTEPDLQDAYLRVHTQIRARHLFARTRTQAEHLRDRLLEGERFEALALEVFNDSALAHSGGDLGWFSYDEMDPAFEDTAFALVPGVVSHPVRTAQGYSIIRVDERQVQPLLTESDYARRRDKLATYVLDRKRILARRNYVQDLVDRLGLAYEERALTDLQRQVRGTFVMPDDEALEDWLSLPLLHFTTSGRTLTWTIDDFRREAGYTDPEHRSQVRTPEDLQEFIEGVVTRQALLMEARAAGLDQHPDLPVALREAMTGWLAGGARARITNELETDDAVRALQEQIDALRQRFDVEVRLDRLTSLALSAN